ncbi:hypothetical protein H6P81_018234 [Aristolochia fimbriata]|uniref:Aminotransferase-like plant mobile domain-containing protein n=1 Tax=Aristolochia fimbriata TaxID=158543 RepID=A0AAV7E0E3_ARIFI|nr:hypothetical protein H6P81_018234 [Aristolochia fimbriata]
MAAPSVNLTGGLRVFDHAVTVGGEPLLTMALYMEGEASRITYCPSGESIFGGHAVQRPPLVDCSLPHGSLSRPLATGERVFFIPCHDSSCEDEDVAAGLETFALQSALRTVNQSLLPQTLADDFMDGGAFIDAWCPKTNTLITCQGELSITLLDMDRIYDLPISGQFYDEVCPMVADFTDVRSSALPYNYQYFFLAYHRLCQCSESTTAPLSTAYWVSFWHAAYEKGAATSRERTTTKQDVFNLLRVMPGKEDEVHLAALLFLWLSQFVFRANGGDDLRPMVFKVASYWPLGSISP